MKEIVIKKGTKVIVKLGTPKVIGDVAEIYGAVGVSGYFVTCSKCSFSERNEIYAIAVQRLLEHWFTKHAP